MAEFPSRVTPELFRSAMSCVTAAVHVVTTTGISGDGGITATAVCSISDSPPRLLVCLNTRSRAHELVLASGVLAVNVLSREQQDVASAFAGHGGLPMHERFLRADWVRGQTGSPLLVGSLAVFDCTVESAIEMGTHRIFICNVESTAVSGGTSCLVYGYRRFLSAEFGGEASSSNSVQAFPRCTSERSILATDSELRALASSRL